MVIIVLNFHIILLYKAERQYTLRGFVKLKKSKTPRKNSEVGEWVKFQVEFILGVILYFFVYMFKKIGLGGGWCLDF